MREKSSQSMNTKLRKTYFRGGETRVMKKTLSSILVFALVLTMLVPAFAFAADKTAEQMVEELNAKYEKLFQGVNEAGDLDLDGKVQRDALAKILATVAGLEVVPPAADAEPMFSDVADNWAYLQGYIGAAFEAKYLDGVGEGKFNPRGDVTYAMLATVLARVLDVEVKDATPWYAGNLAAVQELGFMTNVTVEAATQTAPRSALVLAAYVADQNLEPAVPVVPVQIKSATAVTNTLVDVTLVEAVTAVDAGAFSIVDKDGKALDVNSAELNADGDVVTLTTATHTAGALYTLTANGASAKFVGQEGVTAKLEVSTSALASSNVKVKVTFSANVGASALNPANYAIDNGLSVLAAAFDGTNKNVIVLTTSEQSSGKLYAVTVSNVVDLYGNSLDSAKTKAYFGGKSADKDGPTVTTSAVAQTNTSVDVTLSDSSDFNKATVTNIANYNINDLTVTAASFDADTGVVTLTTSSQTSGKLYTITVSNVTDEFGNVVKSDANKAYFGGKSADKDGPTVTTSATATANNKVDVTFGDASALNEDSVKNIANYSINDLTVTEATYTKASKTVTLTTTAQTSGKLYTVTVSNVTDEYGNVVKSDANKAYFGGKAVDTTNPTYSAQSLDNKTVRVTFSTKVAASSVKPYNFFVEGLGYALSATVNTTFDATGKTVDIKTVGQTSGKVYKLEVDDVANLDGTAVKADSFANFSGQGTLSTSAPKVLAAVALDNKTVAITLDSTIAAVPAVRILENDSTTQYDTTTESFDGSARDKLVVRLDAKTLVEGTLYYVEVTNAIGTNGVAIGTSNKALFAGNGTTSVGPKVVSAVAVDNNTVDVYFDKAVQFGNNEAATKATINLLTNANAAVNYNSTATPVTAQKVVISTDGTKMTVFFNHATNALTLTEGNIYKVEFDTLAEVEDLFGQALVETTASAGYARVQFAAVATAVAGPKVVTAVAVDRYTVDIVFNSPIAAVDNDTAGGGKDLKDVFTIEGISTPPVAELARVEGTDKVRVFFNEGGKTALNEGSVYTIRYTPITTANDEVYIAGTNGVAASVGATSGYAEVSFAAVPTAPAGPSITAIQNINSNTIKVTLNKATDNAVLNTEITVRNVTDDAGIADGDITVLAGDSKSFYVVYTDGVLEAGKTYSIALETAIKDESGLRSAATTALTFGGIATFNLVVSSADDGTDTTLTVDTFKKLSDAVVQDKLLRVRDFATGAVVVAAGAAGNEVTEAETITVAGVTTGTWIVEGTDGLVSITVVK